MGEVRVPAAARWGAQTQRAVENLPISGLRLDPRLVAALGVIKAEAALVNARMGVLPPDLADAVAAAADVPQAPDEAPPADATEEAPAAETATEPAASGGEGEGGAAQETPDQDAEPPSEPASPEQPAESGDTETTTNDDQADASA
jgi:hypothetical protein